MLLLYFNMNATKILNYIKLKKNLYKTISPKYSTHPFKYIEIQERWRGKDNVPKSWELIYRAPMDKIITWASTYITATSGVCACLGLYYGLFSNYRFDPNNPIYLGDSNIVVADSLPECIGFIVIYILFHVAIKILISRYVLRIYKNDDQYMAIFRGHLFDSIKKHKFHLDDFSKVNPVITLGWRDSRYTLGKKKSIIFQQHFRSPAFFNRLLYKENKVDDY